MFIRRSTPEDLPAMLEIYAHARQFMAEHGNPRQWGPTNWPPEALLREDIAAGRSYVCQEDGTVAATFAYLYGENIEPTYTDMVQGAWLKDGPYGVVHRLASSGKVRGAATCCMNWAWDQCHHQRIDTHPDNTVMQGLLEKLGYRKCGIIHVVEDQDPRIGYEKID